MAGSRYRRPMTYDEESQIAERVRSRLGPGVKVDGRWATVSRHGNDVRFHEHAPRRGDPGSYAIIQILAHQDGGIVVRSVRPPGEFHDARFAESAKKIIETAVREDGQVVVPPGRRGQPVQPPPTAAQLRREVANHMIRSGVRPSRTRKRRTRV